MTENGEQLRKQLNASFDIEEFKALCADLGVDYDSLVGEGKSAKVRELVSYHDRRDTTDELIMAAYRLRPDQRRWPAIASRNEGKATDRMLMMQVGRVEIRQDQTDSKISELKTEVSELKTEVRQSGDETKQNSSTMSTMITMQAIIFTALMFVMGGMILVLAIIL